MKYILESPEVLLAYTNIDMLAIVLSDLEKQIGIINPNPIERMVDEATGYREAKVREQIRLVIETVEKIIYYKLIIEADVSVDRRFIELLKELLNEPQQ